MWVGAGSVPSDHRIADQGEQPVRGDIEADCERAVEVIIDLYLELGVYSYDEVVNQAEHGAQAAALARAAGAEDSLVAAALLHDIGHLILLGPTEHADPSTDLAHERIGARYLARRFPPSVSAPLALHVAAKRYLCAVEPDYRDLLSPASTRSLELQGGPFDAVGDTRFEQHERWRDAIELRRWDDTAKVQGLSVPPVESYRELLVGLLVP